MVNTEKNSGSIFDNAPDQLKYGAVIAGRSDLKIIDVQEFPNEGIRVEVIEYEDLRGINNFALAQHIWFAKQQNVRPRQVVIYSLNGHFKTQAGAMHYQQGPLNMNTGINSIGKMGKQLFTGAVTKEAMAMPEYKGSGFVVCEPSLKFFKIIKLEPNQAIICDKGLFYAASGNVTIQATYAGNVSGSLMGGEGIFQQLITGPGWVVLELPVPMSEIHKMQLNNDIAKVDGNFVLLRDASISMSTERSSTTLIGSAVSGEGLVNVYRGTGEMWVAPTMSIYGRN